MRKRVVWIRNRMNHVGHAEVLVAFSARLLLDRAGHQVFGLQDKPGEC